MSEQVKDDAAAFMRSGYDVMPTANRGFVVRNNPYLTSGHPAGPSSTMAFTNSTDFIAWVTKAHAAYDKDAA